MSREIKLGLLTVITLFLAIWGYKFIKGQNLFKSSATYYTTFSDVTSLAVSSDVLVNGYKVGAVTEIKLNPENVKAMDVYFRIDGAIGVPKDAVVLMKNDGLMGGRVLTLLFDKHCTEGNCAASGSKLPNKIVGLLGSMVSQDEVSTYMDGATKSARDLMQDIGKEGNNTKIDLIVRNLEATMSNMNAMTSTFNKIMLQSQTNIAGMTANMNKITKNLADNNALITSMLSNLNTTSQQLASADIGKTISKTNTMIETSTTSVKKLETTLDASTKTMKQLDELLKKINDGGGSLGKLMNDKNLYNNLEATSKNMSLLLQDLRLNPKRYVNVSLIGRKDKPYTLPENDPATKLQENKN
jgi:phospholipid/cholesterol/gamma-HCH transport system substrate-binding protein